MRGGRAAMAAVIGVTAMLVAGAPAWGEGAMVSEQLGDTGWQVNFKHLDATSVDHVHVGFQFYPSEHPTNEEGPVNTAEVYVDDPGVAIAGDGDHCTGGMGHARCVYYAQDYTPIGGGDPILVGSTASRARGGIDVYLGGGNDSFRIDEPVLSLIVDGGAGNDMIDGRIVPPDCFCYHYPETYGLNNITGGPGSDAIFAEGTGGHLKGGPANDFITIQAVPDQAKCTTPAADGGPGSDKLTTPCALDLEHNPYGHFESFTGPKLLGTNGPDVLSTPDTGGFIDGRGGKDFVVGGKGDDGIIGGPGADTIVDHGGTNVIRGGPGADAITSRNGATKAFGDGGDDRIKTPDTTDFGYGDDTFSGGAGDDVLSCGACTLNGDDANDRLRCAAKCVMSDGAGADDVRGGALEGDLVIAGAGNDIYRGGGGAFQTAYSPTCLPDCDASTRDRISFANATAGVSLTFDGVANDGPAGEQDNVTGFDAVIGSRFDDSIHAPGQGLAVFAGDGNDKLAGGAATDVLIGQGGDDTIDGGGGDDAIAGTDGNDTLNGNLGDDTITGDLGDDTIDGGAGADRINGNAGNDHLAGGVGNDVLFGNLDSDTLDGGDGDDLLDPGKDPDDVVGGAGTDTVSYFGDSAGHLIIIDPTVNPPVVKPDAQRDHIHADVENATGGEGDDTIVGNDLPNVLQGDYGSDTIRGMDGDDTIYLTQPDYDEAPYGFTDTGNKGYGGAGNDVIYGTFFNDTIEGNLGDDKLFGLSGDDTLTGGQGTDQFDCGNGSDTVTDNAAGEQRTACETVQP